MELPDALLKDFFSTYFHEDWALEAATPDEVVIGFARNAKSDVARALGEAMLDYSRRFKNDEDLENHLFYELGCYYPPSDSGLSARIWLTRMAGLLMSD
jgi:CdiI immunity protein